jgi:hypothetical protein
MNGRTSRLLRKYNLAVRNINPAYAKTSAAMARFWNVVPKNQRRACRVSILLHLAQINEG